MKNVLMCFAVILILLFSAGCNNSTSSESYNRDSNYADSKASQSENMEDFIIPASNITELENGLSTVRFDGDYAFDLFLEQGGAATDQDVFRFISQSLIGTNTDLRMQAEGFGCSTISIKKYRRRIFIRTKL